MSCEGHLEEPVSTSEADVYAFGSLCYEVGTHIYCYMGDGIHHDVGLYGQRPVPRPLVMEGDNES